MTGYILIILVLFFTLGTAFFYFGLAALGVDMWKVSLFSLFIFALGHAFDEYMEYEKSKKDKKND